MEMNQCIILTAVTLLCAGLIVGVTSLRCYKCDSRTTSLCGATFGLTSNQTEFIVDNCENCLKTVATDGEVYRNCTIKVRRSFSYKTGCKRENSIEVCSCSKDMCNAATNKMATLPVLAFSVLALFTISKVV